MGTHGSGEKRKKEKKRKKKRTGGKRSHGRGYFGGKGKIREEHLRGGRIGESHYEVRGGRGLIQGPAAMWAYISNARRDYT